MASPGNQHCVNCIGTLSFPVDCCVSSYDKQNEESLKLHVNANQLG